jgi:hypothetical protein
MTNQKSRREILRGSLAFAALSVFGIPEWALPALAQSDTLVPFTDLPDNTVVYFFPMPKSVRITITVCDPDKRGIEPYWTAGVFASLYYTMPNLSQMVRPTPRWEFYN